MNRRLLPALTLLAAFAAFAVVPAAARNWIDSQGRSIEGDYLEVRDGAVRIRLDDGGIISIPLDVLAKADQEFVRQRDMTAKADLVALAVRRIDAAVDAGLAKHDLEYNEGLNDHMFARRIYLDLAGRIPSYEELQEFLRSDRPEKRQDLVVRLLGSPDFTSHTYNYFAELLRIRTHFPDTILRNDAFIYWLKEQIQTNRPFDELVREMVVAEGRLWDNPAVGYHLRDDGMKLDHVSFMGKVFLGTDITCAQCHDDPFSLWSQYEYYELSAFLADLDTKSPPVESKNLPNQQELEAYLAAQNGLDPEVKEDQDRIRNLAGRYQRALRDMSRASELAVRTVDDAVMKLPDTYQYDDARPREVVAPRVLFGDEHRHAGAFTPRERLAAWLTSRDNEQFAMNIANRIWARLMGRGVCEPLHDIAPRKADNPELIKVLAEEMLTLDFDLKAFTWAVVNTKAYNRLATRKTVTVNDPYYFPGPVLRRMTAEQIWDSLVTLMVEDPMQFRLSSGKEYLDLINVTNTPTTSVEAFVARIDEYYQFKPEQILVDREGVPIFEAKPEKKERKFGESLMASPTAKKSAEPSDEEMTTSFLKEAQEKKVLLVRASELPQPSDPAHFLSMFGQSNRTFVVGASTLDGSVPQVMELMNGYATDILTSPGSRLFIEMKGLRSNFERADVVFMSILSREALPGEQHLLDKELRSDGDGVLADLIWALLNTPEFLFVK